MARIATSKARPSRPVVITLEPEAGGTRVVLRHHRLPDDGQRQQHTGGWQMYLDRLALVTLGRDPGPDPNAAEVAGR